MNKILNQREQLMHDIETILAGFDVDEQDELAEKLCDAVIKNFPTEHVQGENQELTEKLQAEASQKSNDLMDKGRAELARELLKWLEGQEG